MSNDDITVEILRDIRAEIRNTNGKLDGLAQRVDGLAQELGRRIDETNDELRGFKLETRENFRRVDDRFERLESRLDNIVTIAGAHHGDLAARVLRIEQHLTLVP